MTGRARHLGALAAFLLGGGFVACSSVSRPPAQESTPGSDASTLGDTGSTSTKDGSSDAALHGDAEAGLGSDAQGPVDGGDAGPPAEAGDGGGIPPPPNAICNAGATWGAGVLLSISSLSDDELDAITPDELSIAWTEGTGSAATLVYADRAASTDVFNAPQTVAAGSFSTARVALSPDGLRLVVVNANGQGFLELTRTSRMPPGNAFGAPAIGSYANYAVGPGDAGALPAGESYGDPVLSADDNAFYYSVYGDGLTATIFRAARLIPTDSWPVGVALTAASGLAAQGSLRRQPTAISSDEQTLFFWDQVMGTERAAFIDESTGGFDIFVDLGARAMAAPNAACTTLYYSAAGASSVDLFEAAD